MSMILPVSINQTHLITLHVHDLLAMIGVARNSGIVGTLALMTGGEHLYEADLESLCMVVKIESETEATDRSRPPILKLKPEGG